MADLQDTQNTAAEGDVVADNGSQAEEESEEHRTNLLEVLKQHSEEAGKTFQIHRLLVAIKQGSKPGLENEVSSAVSESITYGSLGGMLLLLPGCGLLCLEGEGKAVVNAAFKVQEVVKSGIVTAANVVSTIQDAPRPAFTFWAVRNLSVNKGDGTMFEEESLPAAIAEISLNLQNIGKALAALPDSERQKKLDQLKTSFHNEIPRIEDVMGLASNEDLPSLEEYLDIYHGPFDLTLDSELVWPVPPAMEY